MAFLNAIIAKRKGRSSASCGWMSIIPFVGYVLSGILISCTDREVVEKIDQILERLDGFVRLKKSADKQIAKGYSIVEKRSHLKPKVNQAASLRSPSFESSLMTYTAFAML